MCVIAYMPVKSIKILALQWHHQQNYIKATMELNYEYDSLYFTGTIV